MRRLLIAPMALVFMVGSVHATVLPDDILAELNRRYDVFVNVDGSTQVEPSELFEDWDTPARFPNATRNTIQGPDAGINAATRALMLVDSQEPSLPHVRYRITYRLDDAPDFQGYSNAYVEVTRFNLGPARHADVVASTPEDIPVAPAKEFGIGPNVSWRFVMGWHQSSVAQAEVVSRRVLSQAQADAMDCLGAPCLAMESPQGPVGEWKQATPPSMKPAAYVMQTNGVATAARTSELLYQHASGGQGQIEALSMHASEPQLTFVISVNVDGQDDVVDGLLHQQLLQDDAISDVWTRYLDTGHDTAEWKDHYEYHPGRS